MGKRHFNGDCRPNLATIVRAIGEALERRGCVLVELYLVGGYGRVASGASCGIPLAKLQEMINLSDKTHGDVDVLVGYRSSKDQIAIEASDIEYDLNSGAERRDLGTKDFQIDIWLSDLPITPKSSTAVRLYP